MSWLDHKELKICKGVYIAPGDPNSVEHTLVTINLMQNSTGIALAGTDGWSPQLPALKSGGVWSDSPLDDGRTLLAGNDGNVTETMHLVVTGPDMISAQRTLMSLYLMARDCREFWTGNAQIDPVYIQWWASCGAGRQYARIYNMEIAPEFADAPKPTINITLTIEREPYWLPIPPGANPVQWRFEFYNQPYSYLNGSISLSTTNMVFQAAQNRSEFTKSGSSETLISDNCITIPASVIPGDAPALMQFISQDITGNTQIIVGKKTTKITQYINTTTPLFLPQNLVFVAASGILGTDATATADTGASQNESALARRMEVSFATATNQLRYTTPSPFNRTNRFIGRFMVFMRCRQSSGSVGDISMYLRYGATIATDTDGVKLNVVNPQVIAGTGNTTNWGLAYMGVVSSPQLPGVADVTLGGSAQAGVNGSTSATFNFGLFAARSTGASLLYVNDIILIPIDEGSFTIEYAEGISSNPNVYDETGYLTHGTPDIHARCSLPGATVQNAKFTGTGIQLTPNIENRLYFIAYDTNIQSVINHTINVSINLVPRWRGIRDV